MEYYFNNLDHTKFQSLINGILVARFGEDIRLTPLRGPDGGRDAETAPGNPYMEFVVGDEAPRPPFLAPLRKGRYLFQVKHHRTTDTRLADARDAVVADFGKEVAENVLTRAAEEQVNYFFLVTNVPSSARALEKIDRRRTDLLTGVENLHADVWWQERVTALLDQMPALWSSFPEMFAGAKVPLLAEVAAEAEGRLSRAVRLALDQQYERDSSVKFRQIELEQSLSRLFVDLDVSIEHLAVEEQEEVMAHQPWDPMAQEGRDFRLYYPYSSRLVSALGLLLDERTSVSRKILLEGGPGQGKSTLTQMVAQICRAHILAKRDLDPEGRWAAPEKARLPIRIELGSFAKWLGENRSGSLEQYLASTFGQDAGGSQIGVDDMYDIVRDSPSLLILDGLDEVGSEELRDDVLEKIRECVHRFEDVLHTDLRVVVTTRPPAIAGRRERLPDFRRFCIASLEPMRIQRYTDRWLSAQVQSEEDRERVQTAFGRRLQEPHVEALARNPMQLSVLLHFIRLKGEAFPDRRADLYRDYFQTVIDRDVEKSDMLRENRQIIESLHQFLGYKIHAFTESKVAGGSLQRSELLQLVEGWLASLGYETKSAGQLFKVGEERLGLIVTLKGEGEQTFHGFEVQPVREYFAAAYINDQIAGNAHDVFQELVRRPFWKEVALFLAGLRRQNERSDLISRARSLDSDKAAGWRQDGRAIVLQLLQEGVFSQPPHVFSDALDFIIDLLDPHVVRSQSEPRGLLAAIPSLTKQSESVRPRARLQSIVESHFSCDDEYVVQRLFSVASDVLEADRMVRNITSYRSTDDDLTGKVRLAWPHIWQLNVCQAANDPSYWAGIPDDVWARSWWNGALGAYHSQDIVNGSKLHQYLVEQLAMNSFNLNAGLRLEQYTLKPDSRLAVWELVRYLQTLSLIGIAGLDMSDNLWDQLAPSTGELPDLQYDGLQEPTRQLLSGLLAILGEVVAAFRAKEHRDKVVKASHVDAIQAYVQEVGLHSWLAVKCGNFIVHALRPGSTATFYWARPDDDKWYNRQEAAGEHLAALAQLVEPFYADLSFDPPMRHHNPTRVRTEPGGQLEAVVELMAEATRRGAVPPLRWMSYLPITPTMLRPLVEACRDCLPALLKHLGTLPFVEGARGKPLLTRDTQKILAIARASDDRDVLSGALIALSTSRYFRSAGAELLVKLHRTGGPTHAFASIAHRGRRFEQIRLEADELGILAAAAEAILGSPHDHRFDVVTGAAHYLHELYDVNAPRPLVDMEDILGLATQQT